MSFLSAVSSVGTGGLFTYIKLGLAVTIIVGIIGIIGYLYMDNKAKSAQLLADMTVQQQLKDTISADQLEIQATKDALKQQQQITSDVTNKFSTIDTNLLKLQGSLSVVINGKKVELGQAAIQQPTVIEQKLNQATKNVLRCNEIATGSPITQDDATNPACPELITQVTTNAKK